MLPNKIAHNAIAHKFRYFVRQTVWFNQSSSSQGAEGITIFDSFVKDEAICSEKQTL